MIEVALSWPPAGQIGGSMSDDAPVRRVRPTERTAGESTPGMTRAQAVATGTMWAGFVSTDAGMVSGWHHHGEYETSIYVISGALRMEYGPAGAEALEAAPGDFVYVPPHAIHREATHQTKNRPLSWCGQGPATRWSMSKARP
jgi:uncharacterized RmlC-like cupin family protein